MENEELSIIFYYFRRKLYQSAQALCEASLRRRADPILSFWKATASFFMEKYNEAIRDLTFLLPVNDLEFIVPMVLIQAYRLSPIKNTEAIQETEARLTLGESQTMSPKIMFMIFFFLLLNNDLNEAIQWASKLRKDSSWSAYAFAWIDLMDTSISSDPLPDSLNIHQDGMACLIHLIFIKERQKQHDLFTPLLAQLNYLPLKIEYMYSCFEGGLHTEAREIALQLQQTSQPLLIFDAALGFFLVSFFLNEEKESKTEFDHLITVLHRTEYNNPILLSSLLQLLLKLPYDSKSNSDHLQLIHVAPSLQQLGKRLIELQPNSSHAYKHLGLVYFRLNQSTKALEAFQKALELDPTSVLALEGQLMCQLILQSNFQNTKDLELLESMTSSSSTSPWTYYLCYLNHWYHCHQPDQAFFYLKEVVQKVFDQIALTSGFQYLVTMDLHLLSLAAEQLLELCPTQPVTLASDPMHAFTELSDYFQHVYPGSGDTLYFKAMTKHLHHQTSNFIDTFQKKLNQTFSYHFPCALLLAEMYIHLENYSEAHVTLEGALASNLEANQDPFFKLLNIKLSRLEQPTSNLISTSALTSLQTMSVSSLSQRHKVLYFSELAWHQSDVAKAKEAIQQGQTMVYGIHLAELDLVLAEIYLSYQRYQEALTQFHSVQHPCFQIYQRIADFYYQRKEFRMYLETCQKWVDDQGTQVAYMGLAQAYLVLDDIDRAIDTLNLALCCYPEDSTLILEIARILTMHHAYGRAMDYLKQRSDVPQCQLALIQLYFKLHQDDDIEAFINDNSSNTSSFKIEWTPELHGVLAKMYLRQNKKKEASDHLQQAMQSLPTSSPWLADMYLQLYLIHQDMDYLHRSLNAYPTKQVLILMTKDAIQHRLFNQADSYIQELIKLTSSSNTTTTTTNSIKEIDVHYLQIDLYLQQRKFEKAIQIQLELLTKFPFNFKVLAGHLSLVYRTGELEKVEKKMKLVMDIEDPGAYYCKGLFYKFQNKVYEAVVEFRKCQGDPDWQPSAWQQILEFLIFPNLAELHTPLDPALLEKANIFIQELPDNDFKTFWKVCHFCGTKKKSDLEQALTLVQTSLPSDSVLALLSQSFIFIMLKSESKAKNFLKRLAKEEWRYTDALILETGWLMLADLYLQQGKHEPADVLVKSCLDSNKMCAKAWELYARVTETKDLMGSIEYWTRAWKVHSESDLTVAWKLAKLLLRAQKYTEAIDICHQVLHREPESEIRQEVLEKARAGLRL